MAIPKMFNRRNMLLNGAMLGGCYGASKAGDMIKENPYMNQEQKENIMLKRSVKGAAIGTAGAAIGGHYIRGAIKGVGGILKKSEMEVPTDSEIGKLPEAEEEVRESPNEEEKEKMRNTIDERKQHYKDLIEKMSNYQNDINCAKCGYEGEPLDDGRCPTCGSLNGSYPRDGEYCGRVEDDFTMKQQKLEDTYQAIQKAREELYNQSIY